MGFIYWIASYPHSGSTRLRTLLASLVSGGLNGDPAAVQEIVPDATLGQFYQRFLSVPIEQASSAELATARPHAHRLMAEKTQNFLFLNTHSMLTVHYGTSTITAGASAGVVYLLRNPLDVVVSLAATSGRSIDWAINILNASGQELARRPGHAYEVSGSWSENIGSWTEKNERILTLRQEEVEADAVAAYRKVIGFLKMDVSDEQLRRAIDDQVPDPTLLGTGLWRDQLSDPQVARVVGPNAEMMRQNGYWLPEFDALLAAQDAADGVAP